MAKLRTPSSSIAALVRRAQRALELSRRLIAQSRVEREELDKVLAIARLDRERRGTIPDRRSRVRRPEDVQADGVRSSQAPARTGQPA
ncbi:MAG: hypothetical protein V4505_24830 [Pseudomonadota bacterium]